MEAIYTHILVKHPKQLVPRLREILRPIVIVDGIETVLSFNNDLGKGTFTIIFVPNEFQNIHFGGVFHKNFSIDYSHSQLPVTSYIHLSSGSLNVSIGFDNNYFKIGLEQQFVYRQGLRTSAFFKWPRNKFVDFNLLKVFDMSFIDTEATKYTSDSVNGHSKSNDNSVIISRINKKYQLGRSMKINSSEVGDKRTYDLIEKVKSLVRFHSNLIAD